jgi:DNA-binding beta-propeller fold protein YncE
VVSEQYPSVPEDLGPGAMIAGYRLEERIGHGGMAAVFRAHDSRLDRQVALKILAPGLRLDEAFRQRFIRESRSAAGVEDPHIIPVFEAGEADGVLFIAMRYVRGGDVRSLIDRFGPLPTAQVAELVSQVASALDAAHARGLVHRDVKPANMLLERSPAEGRPDHVYLSDFGLSKASLEGSGLTVSGQFLGTLDYVAPEQIRGRPVDGKADQYSLACSAFEMLSGRPPFHRDEGVSVMYAHLSDPPPSLLTGRPDLPAQIDAVMTRALTKEPAGRYPTCRDLAVAVQRALDPAVGRNDPPSAGRTGAAPPPGPIPEIAVPMTAAGPRDELILGAALVGLTGPPAEQQQPAAVRPVTRDGLTAPTPGPGEPADLPKASPAATGPGGSALPAEQASRRSWWRSPAPVAGLCAAAVLVGGGAAYLAGRGHPPSRTAGRGADAAALAAPGCSSAVAQAGLLTGIRSATVPTGGGYPFAIAVTPDGRYEFVTTGKRIAVLRNSASRLAPRLIGSFAAPGAGSGDALTHNGKLLLAAAGSGALVINVAKAEAGVADPIAGRLTIPAGSLAADVLTTANDEYAFISLKAEVAVFNLRQALAGGFGRAGFIGAVPLAGDPVGMATDGQWLYVASLGGRLSVISLARAEIDPAHAFVSAAPAGCFPARVLLSDHGAVVWVTARQSNALLAFSAARLRADPQRALIAKVMVGEQPVGETLGRGGTILVADSDMGNVPGRTPNLAVVSTTSALHGRPALLGYLPTGLLPHQFAVEKGGAIILVTVQDEHEVEAIDAAELP